MEITESAVREMAREVRGLFPPDRVLEAILAYHAMLREPEEPKSFVTYAHGQMSAILGVEEDRLILVELSDDHLSGESIRLDHLVSVTATGSPNPHGYEWLPERWALNFAHRGPIEIAEVTTKNRERIAQLLAGLPK